MLPDIDGFQLIDAIKSETPDKSVIFISAPHSNLDWIIGLEKGSDDYLAKPFDPQELILRTKKILNRVYKNNKFSDRQIIYNYYIIYTAKRKVYDQEKEEIRITSKEFELLLYFLENKEQAISRDQILENICDNNYIGMERVVDDLICRLRNKMPAIKLETIYAYGYRLANI